MKISTRFSHGAGGIGRMLFTLLIITVLFFVSGILVAKTDWIRGIAERKLSRKLGDQVSIGRTYLSFPRCHFVMESVLTPGFGDSTAGFSIDEVRIAAGFPVCYIVHRASVNLVQDKDKQWTPVSLRRIGDLPSRNVREITAATEKIRDDQSLKIEHATLRWFDSDGALAALASDVNFEMRPVEIADDSIYFYGLSLYSAEGFTGGKVLDIERTWLASEKKDYVELSSSGGKPESLDESFFGDPTEPAAEEVSAENEASLPVSVADEGVVPEEDLSVDAASDNDDRDEGGESEAETEESESDRHSDDWAG